MSRKVVLVDAFSAADRKLLSIAAGYVSFAGTVACSQAVQLAIGIDTGLNYLGRYSRGGL